MFKKIIPYICITILLVVVFLFVFKNNNTTNVENNGDNNNQIQQTTTPVHNEEIKENFENGIDGKTTLQNIKTALISYKVDDVEDMYFETSNPKCDKGTAITLLLYSNNIAVPLTQIKTVELKTSGGTIIDADIQTHLLNNKKACVIFIKIEDKKLLENMSVTIKTFDSKQATLPLPTQEDVEKVFLFTTDINEAKQGDLITISGCPYYILDNSLFNSYIFMYNEEYYSEAIVGTILVPLYNTYRYMLSDSNFSAVYFSEDNIEDDKGISTTVKVNDEDIKKEYGHKLQGLYAELLTSTYRIKLTGPDDTESVEDRDDMISRTWYKISSENDALFRALS